MATPASTRPPSPSPPIAKPPSPTPGDPVKALSLTNPSNASSHSNAFYMDPSSVSASSSTNVSPPKVPGEDVPTVEGRREVYLWGSSDSGKEASPNRAVGSGGFQGSPLAFSDEEVGGSGNASAVGGSPDLSFTPGSTTDSTASWSVIGRTLGSQTDSPSRLSGSDKFGEEAFYSKSNITAPKSGSYHLPAPLSRQPSLPSYIPSPPKWRLSEGQPHPQRRPSPPPKASQDGPLQALKDLVQSLVNRVTALETTVQRQERDLFKLRQSQHQQNQQHQQQQQQQHQQHQQQQHQQLQQQHHQHQHQHHLQSMPLAAPGNHGLGLTMSSASPFSAGIVQIGGPKPIDYRSPAPVVDYGAAERLAGIAAGGVGVPNMNQVNYKTLLETDADIDFVYFIRRIVELNDQQASIFMQQKIKQSVDSNSRQGDKTREELTRVITETALDLMMNRFGNFLVSRAIEYATPRERILLAEQIRGHVLSLACDTFATHCLQKMIDADAESAFSSVKQDDGRSSGKTKGVRLLIAGELLQKRESLTHKSAGHVWARLLNSAGGVGEGGAGEMGRALDSLMKGYWARTAKDEVGSLIVQSVLENWRDEEKVIVIEELLNDINSCAVQQWGNFVILHLIEHSSDPIQQRIFERLFHPQTACELSSDNYGAKAMEKALKVCGMQSQLVEDYVTAICEWGNGRPAVIDIACHASGSQVLTLLFTSAPSPLKEMLISVIRRHGVTLKSSKHGAKIWFLVERTRAWVGH